MGIFRGDGGTGDSNTDATVTAVTEQATIATTKASEAADSATAAGTSATNAASSASASSVSSAASSTYAGEAASSATSAATSATASAASATAAATAETNAETAETNAETAETNAAASAATATTKAGEAATSATSASTSASTATTKASEAATSASNAATSETNAGTSASTATTKASEASTSASNAATSEANAAASYDDFDDRYLGAKSSNPTTDNDGDALVTGALFFNTTTNSMKVWSGSAWLDAYASLSGALIATNNLSDLNNTTTSRTNLGLGTAATTASTDYATAAQGTTADNALPKSGGAMTGAITTNSTFDGRDVATDGTKLDGIEAGADVTDTTNVVAALSAGTGISLSNGGVIANTSPDQTVALTGAGTTTVTGTYPNFTITGAGTTYTAGTGITLTGTEFSIGQGVATTDSPTFAGLTVDTDTLYVDSTNNTVGIGTNNPDYSLTIVADDPDIRQEMPSSSSASLIQHLFTVDGVQEGQVVYNKASGSEYFGLRTTKDITFQTGGSAERMRILADGKVGIGTTSPEYNLDVTAADNVTTTTAISVQNSARNYGLGLGAYTLTNRNIGGTATTIDYTFDIGGDAIFKTSNAERMLIASTGGSTFTSDDGITLHTATNGVGAAIKFSDHASGGGYTQKGTLVYYHADGSSYGSGCAFRFESTEPSTSVVGNKAVFDNYLVKPASGTGAGSLVIDASRNITANFMKADRIYSNDDGSTGYFFNDSSTRTAYAGGDFYIQSSVGNCYIYATNTYLGNTSGDIIHTRGNAVSGNNFLLASNGDFYVNARYGSNQLAFACRAWGRYEMSGTHSFRDDEGFSSITDIGTGRSRLNFQNSMPNSYYSVNLTTGSTSYSSQVCSASVYSLATTLFYVSVEDLDGGFIDRDQMNVMVVR